MPTISAAIYRLVCIARTRESKRIVTISGFRLKVNDYCQRKDLTDIFNFASGNAGSLFAEDVS